MKNNTFLSVLGGKINASNFEEKQFWGENWIFLKKKLNFLEFFKKNKNTKLFGSALHIRVGG